MEQVAERPSFAARTDGASVTSCSATGWRSALMALTKGTAVIMPFTLPTRVPTLVSTHTHTHTHTRSHIHSERAHTRTHTYNDILRSGFLSVVSVSW